MASSPWLFDTFAGLYAWFTAQGAWRASCGRMAAYLPEVQAGRRPTVIDLGCGPGVSTFELARRGPDALYVGLDRAPRMLAEARRRQPATRGSARTVWVRADAGALPFGSHCADAMTGHSFLYLLGEQTRSRALAEMLRVLRPGGRVIVMEPSARPAHLAQVLRVSTDPRHVLAVLLWRPFSRLHGRYTPASLADILERAGFVRPTVTEVLGGLGLLGSAEAAPSARPPLSVAGGGVRRESS